MADAGTAAPVTPDPSATPAKPAGGEARPTPKPGAPAPKPQEGNEAQADGPRKVKFRDPHGKEHEVDENELAAKYFRGAKAQDLLSKWEREKAAKEKEWKEREAQLERLRDKGELRKFILEMGHDPRKLGEEFVLEQIEEEKLSPAEKAYREEKAKREALEAKEQERQQQEQQQQYERAKEERANQIGALFADALEEVGVPEALSGMFYPSMARQYRAARAVAIQEAREMAAHTGQPVDYRALMPPAGHYAETLRDAMREMVAKYVKARPPDVGELFKDYAQARPLEELEALIGEREYEGKRLKYPEIVNQRYLKALLEKRKGTPGVAHATAAPGTALGGSYDLPGEVVRNMPADLQNLYWRMQTAHQDEKPGIVRNFEATARKYGVALPVR